MLSPTVYGMKRKPPRGTLARYRDRIVEVLGEARPTHHDQVHPRRWKGTPDGS